MNNLNLTPINPHGLQNVPAKIDTTNKILLQAQGTYIAKITRDRPTAIIFLIDQSGSMNGGTLTMNGLDMNKANAAARIVNATLNELLGKATRDGEMRDYIHFAIIGYGAQAKANVLWQGNLAGKTWVTPQELANNGEVVNLKKVTKLPDGTTHSTLQPTKKWFDAVAEGVTPMHDALTQAQQLLQQWINDEHQESYPPVVINITDGEATDAKAPELIAVAEKIKQLRTNDGHVLLLCCHLSDTEGNGIVFPSNTAELPNDEYANCLFEMSSYMPQRYTDDIDKMKEGTGTGGPYKGMGFNTDGSHLIKFITIGSS